MTCNATKMENKVLKHCSVYVGRGGGKGVFPSAPVLKYTEICNSEKISKVILTPDILRVDCIGPLH